MSLIVNKKPECSVVCEMSIYLRLLLQGKTFVVDVADNNNNNNNNNNKKRKKGKNENGSSMAVMARHGRRENRCT